MNSSLLSPSRLSCCLLVLLVCDVNLSHSLQPCVHNVGLCPTAHQSGLSPGGHGAVAKLFAHCLSTLLLIHFHSYGVAFTQSKQGPYYVLVLAFGL